MAHSGSSESLNVQTAADRLPSGLTDIEQINAAGLVCPNPRVPVVLGFCESLRLAVVWRPRCKVWSCPVCGQINAQMWAFVAASGVEYFQACGEEPAFFTLTSHEKLSPEATFCVWPRVWAKLSTRFRRAHPGIEYLMVPERHADGRLHLHGVTSAPLSKRWLKDNLRECGGGHQADSQPVASPGKVSHYVTKYLMKQLGDDGFPRGFRRVRTSRGWPRPEVSPEDAAWKWVVLTSADSEWIEAEALRRDGYRVVIGDHRTAWAQVEAYKPLAVLKIAVQNLDFSPVT